MSITIRRVNITPPRPPRHYDWRKRRFLEEGFRVARSHVKCPSCKRERSTIRDFFQCCGTHQTKDNLTLAEPVGEYEFNGSIRRQRCTRTAPYTTQDTLKS